jgi:hypothetical protein
MVKDQDQSNLNYSSWRQELLDWGRERGGTHFVWLDADEAFTSNFLPNFKKEILKLKPGQKLVMKWLCLWKSAYVERTDPCIWSNLYKDFIFCDDNVSMFGTTKLHEGRTPGENNATTWVTLPEERGAVLHFQFVAFNRFQIKQVFQRCREYELGHGSARRINYRYLETLDTDNVTVSKIPNEWLTNISNLGTIEDSDISWYNTEIINYFNKKGITFFEPLQIWHIKKYRDMFIQQIGREPRPKTYSKIVIALNTFKKNNSLLREISKKLRP